jgi:hypothetical protein
MLFDRNTTSVGRQRFEIARIGGEHGASGLGSGHHQRVYGRPLPRMTPEEALR